MLAVLSAFIFLLKLTAGQHLDGSITATECVEAFELLQLDFEDFTRFPKYFNENSTMYVAQTGIYHGVDGIEEYIRFVSKSNPYITERDTVAVSPMKLHGFDPVEETCSFSLHRAIRLETNPEMAVEGTVVFAIFTLVEFDYRQNVISTVHTGFKKDSVDLLFGVILNTEGVRNHICDVSGSSLCNETNVGMTHEQCMENLWELPAMTNGDRLDGDSVGCRAIHAILSEWDSRHCPHISFEPQADYQGKVKCQTTIGLQEEDLFDDNFMQEYDDFLDEVFGTTESSYKILSLPKETNKTRELIFGLVVPMVVFVVVFGVIKFTQAKYEKVAESDEPKLLANKASQLSKIIFTWIGVLVVANGLCYLVIWAVSRSNPDWDWTVDYQEVLLSETVDLQNRYHGSPVSFSDTVPFAIMNNDQFRVYTGFIVWITCLIVGLGLEIFVWYHFLQVWCKERELVWRFVQFIFPLLLVVALGAASQGNFFALPVTVLGLWKFGFPETLMYFYLALFGTTLGHTRRLADFLNGAGTVIHHGAASFIIAMLLVGVIPPTKYVYHSTLILVIQHWMTILSYVNKALYAAIVLVVEYYFEWTIFCKLTQIAIFSQSQIRSFINRNHN